MFRTVLTMLTSKFCTNLEQIVLFLGANFGKLSNKRLSIRCFEQKGGGKIERKTKTLALLLTTVFAIAAAGLVASTYAQTSTTSSSTTTTTAPSTASDNAAALQPWGMGMMMGIQGFEGGPGGRGDRFGDGFGGQMGNIQASSAYNETVGNILGNDTDVQKLVSQGYNVTSIRPILSSTISADGTVTIKASTAIVTMQNGTSGFATVNVDITNAKVTQITIITRTVIDKSTTTATTS